MALGEGAALGVLAREPDAEALDEQGAVSERLGGRPVDALTVLDHLAAIGHDAGDGLMRREALGDGGELAADLLEKLKVDAGHAAAGAFLGMADARPFAVEPVGAVGAIGIARRELLLEIGAEVGLHAVDLGAGEKTLLDETLGIDLNHARMLADAAIHQGLGEGRLVSLVMAVTTVAEHVDDHGLAVTLAKLDGDLGHMHHGLGVVAVHVEDRGIDHLGHVGGVRRGTGKAGRGGEADLIIDNEVQRAADAVPAQARQAEAFGDHALSGEGRIAVQEERQHLFALLVVALVLLCPDLAEHDGIDDLEMGGIGGQRQVHAILVELAIGGGAEMVFHVARALDLVGVGRASLELVEDRPVGLAHDIGEHVQASAMGHADDDLADAELPAALDDLLERRHRGFATVEAEALGAGILHVEEALEGLGLDELLQDRLLALRREADLTAFDVFLDPGALLRI